MAEIAAESPSAHIKRRGAHKGTTLRGLNKSQHRYWCRRQLRRLLSDKVSKKATTTSSASNTRPKTCNYVSLARLLLCLSFPCLLFGIYDNGNLLSRFMQTYNNQLQAIVHNNDNYCGTTMNLKEIFVPIRSHVLNQQAALDQLEKTLGEQSATQFIALLGSSGLGKSLTLHLLQEQFPWHENVQRHVWNDIDYMEDNGHLQFVQHFLHRLNYCGRNLLIIDNMPISDVEFVKVINKMVLAQNNASLSDIKRLTVIYVFNLNRMLAQNNYEQQLKQLEQQLLPQSSVIIYESFGKSELEKCIQHEAQLAQLQMDEFTIEDIIKSTDVKVSGCKTVRSKVLIYGKPMFEDENALDN